MDESLPTPSPGAPHDERGVGVQPVVDFVAELRFVADMVQALLARPGEPAIGSARLDRRAAPGLPTALEHAICLRDLLAAASARLDRLVGDAGPIVARCRLLEPVAGYHRWDPGQVAASVAVEAEHLASRASKLLNEDSLPTPGRDGVALLVRSMVREVVDAARGELRDADALSDSVPGPAPAR